MPPHGLECTRTDRLVHLPARSARPRPDENDVADRETELHERQEVHAAHDEVPSNGGGSDGRDADERCDDRQMLFLNDRDLTLSADTAVRPREIALETTVLDGDRRFERAHRRVVLGSDADPRERSDLRDIEEPFAKRLHRSLS